MLSSTPRSFEHFKDVILYRKEYIITLDEVQTNVTSNKLPKLKDLKVGDNGEGLSVSKKEVGVYETKKGGDLCQNQVHIFL